VSWRTALTRRLAVHAIAPHVGRESAPLLVAWNLESIPRIPMRTAGPPLCPAPNLLCLPFRCRVLTLVFLRRPEAPARKPHQHSIGMPRLKLLERRHELVAGVRAKGGGFSFDDDRPVRVSRRHDQSAPWFE